MVAVLWPGLCSTCVNYDSDEKEAGRWAFYSRNCRLARRLDQDAPHINIKKNDSTNEPLVLSSFVRCQSVAVTLLFFCAPRLPRYRLMNGSSLAGADNGRDRAARLWLKAWPVPGRQCAPPDLVRGPGRQFIANHRRPPS